MIRFHDFRNERRELPQTSRRPAQKHAWTPSQPRVGNGAFPNDSVVPRLPDSFVARASWDDVPVLAPRYRDLFGTGTRWPQGWGPEPTDRRSALTDNYRLKVIPETAAAA